MSTGPRELEGQIIRLESRLRGSVAGGSGRETERETMGSDSAGIGSDSR